MVQYAYRQSYSKLLLQAQGVRTERSGVNSVALTESPEIGWNWYTLAGVPEERHCNISPPPSLLPAAFRPVFYFSCKTRSSAVSARTCFIVIHFRSTDSKSLAFSPHFCICGISLSFVSLMLTSQS